MYLKNRSTGYAKLYENNEYSRAAYSEKQVEELKKYEKEQEDA